MNNNSNKTSDIFDPVAIEKKWLEQWESVKAFYEPSSSRSEADREKIYLLFAFAYPSGSGLHVGHVESMTALDIMARYYRMQGKEVFFPVGWDAFGLPAENYAIKTGVPPAQTTVDAINTFRRQIRRIGISYNWGNEIATSHPGYYRWTQWLFLQLFKEGLAYQGTGLVNWCPSCQTVLANEQVVDGHCERCDHEVIQKEMEQWYFKITDYKDELISGLDEVDWPGPTKQQQENWIGKKAGINIDYQVDGLDQTITCFTTRPDTNFGATFIVLAPEHPFAEALARGELEGSDTDLEIKAKKYLEEADKKTELERQQEGRKKSGVFTGYYAINNLTNERMPIWISDFVLAGFGTGAVVGVPGHDKRDFEFAKYVNQKVESGDKGEKIDIPRVVVAPDGDTSPITKVDQVQEDAGTMVNSDFLNGLDIFEAKDKIMDYLVEEGFGEKVVTYRLRDWLISRQRYWGAPIPIIYDPDGQPHAVKDEHLPWKLAEDVDFKPTGESPLASSQELQARTEQYASDNFADLIKKKGWDKSGKGWRPEYDTMDTFVDSSWYYFRYVSARDQEAFADKDQIKKWLPVDFYMIGPEHIVLHLLYSRFFTKFLRDQGYCDFGEPFMKMRHQGMILGPDHRKMSKSKGNVINPDDIIDKFGADTLRVYEMFMGPIEADKPWDTRAVVGVFKFLSRVHGLVTRSVQGETKPGKSAKSNHEPIGGKSSKSASQKDGQAARRKLHQTIRKVTEDIPALKFNTAIAAVMEFMNEAEAAEKAGALDFSREEFESLVKIVAPFAPFLAEELFDALKTDAKNQASSIHTSNWPAWDPELAKDEVVTIAIQVNGKLRDQLEVPADKTEDKEFILSEAKRLPKLVKWLEDSDLVKEIYIPGRIVNLVVE